MPLAILLLALAARAPGVPPPRRRAWRWPVATATSSRAFALRRRAPVRGRRSGAASTSRRRRARRVRAACPGRVDVRRAGARRSRPRRDACAAAARRDAPRARPRARSGAARGSRRARALGVVGAARACCASAPGAAGDRFGYVDPLGAARAARRRRAAVRRRRRWARAARPLAPRAAPGRSRRARAGAAAPRRPRRPGPRLARPGPARGRVPLGGLVRRRRAPRGACARRDGAGDRAPAVAAHAEPSTLERADGLLLRHDADLLRQRGAAPRPRVHDDRAPTSSPATTASAARTSSSSPAPTSTASRSRCAAEREGVDAAGARRPQRRALQGADAAPRRLQRLLHPHHRPAAQAPRSRRSCSASTTTATSTRACTRAGTARAARTSRPRPRSPRATAARSTTSSSTREQEENWFFRLSTFQEPLEQLYAEQPDFVHAARSATTRRCRSSTGGLQDVSLTRGEADLGRRRSRGTPTHVFYVWFDALLNYYTALTYARAGEDLTDRFWPATYHVIGKDILKFHTVFWPALLMAAGLAAARARLRPRLPARRDGAQDEQVARQRARPVRGHRRATAPTRCASTAARRHASAQDGVVVDRRRSSTRYETELANELGNLASRTIAMVARYRDGARARGRARPGARRRTSTASPSEVARAARPRRADAGARGDLAARAAAQPLRRGAGAVEARQGRRRAPASSTRVLALARRGPARRRRPAARRTCPRATASCSPRSARPTLALRGAALGGAPRAARVEPLEPLFPKHSARVIDTHTHLDVCEPPDAELVARGDATRASRGCSRSAPTARRAARALAAAEAFPQVLRRRSAATPTTPTGFDDADLAELARARRARALRGDRRDRPRLLPRLRAARRPGARLRRADRARARDRQAARDPHARGRGRHDRDAARARRRASTVILHCFSMPDRLDECLGARAGGSRSPATSPTRSAQDLAAAAERVPDDRLLVETDAPYLTPQVVRKERNQPAFVDAHRALRRRAPRHRLRGARGDRRAQRRRAVRMVTRRRPPIAAEPAPRCAQFGVRPNRELGQNFLIDSNILGVIERAAELEPDDVVLEIGGGLGVLSEHLAPRAAPRPRRRARPRARAAAARRARRRSTNDDAAPRRRDDARPRARSTPRRPRSSPTCPTASPRARSCARSRSCRASTRWVAMVQKEVGERFAAAPGTAAYGVPSVLAQLACDVRVLRAGLAHGLPPGARTSTRCSSCSSARGPRAAAGRCARSSRRAFAHRRKALPRSLALRPASRRGDPRRAPARRSSALGHPRRRARRAARRPRSFRALCGGAARDGRDDARAGEDQPLPVPRPDARRRPPRARVGHAVGVARRRASRSSPRAGAARRGRLPGRRRPATSPPPRCARFRARTGWDGPPVRLDDRQAHPGRGRDGRRLGRRRRGAAAASRARPGVDDDDAAARDRRRRSAPTSRRRCGPARVLATGAGEALARARRPPAASACSSLPRRASRCRPPTSTARPTGSGLPRERGRPRRAAPAPSSAARRRPARRRCSSTTSSPPRARCCPADRRRARARCATPAPTHALVCGSGPTVARPVRRRRRRARGRGAAATGRRGRSRGAVARARGARRRREARLARRGRGARRVPRAAPPQARADAARRRRDRRRRRWSSTAPASSSCPNLEDADRGRRRARSARGPTCSSARWPSSRPARSSASSPRARRSMLVGGVVAGQGKIDVVALIGDRLGLRRRRRPDELLSSAAGSAASSSSSTARKVQITEERLEQVEGFFDRHGGKAILIGRFVGLVRAIAPFLAGSSGCRSGASCPTTSSAPGLWGTTFVLLGYVFWQQLRPGRRLRRARARSRSARSSSLVVGIVVARALAARRRRTAARRATGSSAQAERPLLRPFARGRCGRCSARRRARPARGSSGTGVTPGELGLELTTLLAVAGVGGFAFFALHRSRCRTPATSRSATARRCDWPPTCARDWLATSRRSSRVLGALAGRRRRSCSVAIGLLLSRRDIAEAVVARRSAWC